MTLLSTSMHDPLRFNEPGTELDPAAVGKYSPVRLRKFRKHDFEELLRLDRECFSPRIAYSRDELMHYLSRPRAIALVAENSEGFIHGFIVAESGRIATDGSAPAGPGAGHVITIDVSAKVRRGGIGSMLMEKIEAEMRAARCDRVYLEVAVDNLSAISFYKRRGYVVVKTLPRYYDRSLDGLRMEKSLKTIADAQSCG